MDNIREKLVEQLRWWAAECDRTNFGCQASKLLVEAADYIIANGVTVQEWIPVTERLPEDGEMAFCHTVYFYDVLQWDDRAGRWVNSFADFKKEFVTHWMPLPLPPKGE